MKILESRYPLGSLKGQKSAGRYIDENLYNNIQSLAEVITDDMTFLGIISSSTLEVGTGKSAFVQQLGEAWIDLVSRLHKIELATLSMNNIVFKPEDLITRAFVVPRFSIVIVDEWDDSHYWSKLGMSLRQFFRKCRQLNLFIIVIIPNFFQLPINYAVTRSVFFIDVRFEGKFERGYFRFYSFKKKKDLYIYGKKNQDYDCVKPDFIGRFTSGYVVDEATYRAAKYKDMVDSEKEDKIPSEKEVTIKLFRQLRYKLPQLTIEKLAEGFGVSERTGNRWLSDENNFEEISETRDTELAPKYTNKIIERIPLTITKPDQPIIV